MEKLITFFTQKRKQLFTTFLTALSACAGSLFYTVVMAIQGGAISNSKTLEGFSYKLMEWSAYAFSFIAFLVPVLSLVGLVMYWRFGRMTKFSALGCYSGVLFIVLYFAVIPPMLVVLWLLGVI